MASEQEEEDELDRLTKLFEAQAEQDVAKLLEKPRPVKKLKRGGGVASTVAGAPLPAENKGFQMLTKMGYKNGSGVGKSASGIVEPIAVEIKPNRLGLGASSKKEAKRKAQAEREAEHAKEMELRLQWEEIERNGQQESYRERSTAQFAARQAERDLTQAIKACEDLDARKGLEMKHPWNNQSFQGIENEINEAAALEQGENVDEWGSRPALEKLAQVVEYLRKEHWYCVYCGVEYENEEDMVHNCPGALPENH